MSEIRVALRLYVAAVLALACAAFVAFVPEPRAANLLLAVSLLGLATVAQLRPIHLTQKMKITVEDSATFAAALLLAPSLAFAVAAGSTLLVYLRRRGAPWFEGAFNSAVSGLAALTGAWVFTALGGDRASVATYAIAALFAAVGMYLVNTGLVDIAVGLQLRRNPLTSWWLVHRRDLPQSTALYGLGALTAIVGDVYPAAIVLFALPVAAVFVSMRETARLRSQTREAIVEFAKLIDLRDRYTHGHSQRVAALAERVALKLRLDGTQVTLLRDAALLHDLGKVHTSDHVLQKPGPLNAEEESEIRLHAEAGAELLRKLPEFWEGASLVRAHHERYDGRGYPRGLAGADVPLEAAIIAVADAWDAMTSDRPYRPARPRADVIAEMQGGRGSQWAPAAVDALLAVVAENEQLAARAAEPARAVESPAGTA
jgi:putative nucleotidyltransferase with HDIG domain